ncbi:immunoglobulin-like domain-containing protein [Aquipuribacter sp. SD81]|uniref:immunoglobulin-like domain-containing protein n=1 Tax=Aquipuribacter sp. SD81 TaxID=3127703 RepID=UPI0030177EC0
MPSPSSPPLRRRACALAAAGALALAAVSVPVASASTTVDDGPAPLLHYTFDGLTSAAAGTTVPDVSGNGYDATVRQSGAQAADGVLSLPGGGAASAGYVEVPTAGLVGQESLTFSTWLSPRSAPGNVAAAFVGAPVAAGASFSSGYWLLNPANPSGYVKSVVTNSVSAGSPWTTEVGPGSTATPTAGVRTPSGAALYTTVVDGAAGRLRVYVDGQQVSDTAIARDVADFGTQLVAYLGRSTYNDPGWAGDVDDFAVYGEALAAAEVQALFGEQALERAVAGTDVPAGATASFTLPTTSYGTQVAWVSDDPAIAVSGGEATVTRPAAGSGDATVTLTATFTVGDASRTATYTVVVPQELSDDVRADLDAAALEVDEPGDVRGNFAVPTTGANGSTVEWSVGEGADRVSLRDGVTDTSRTVVVERPAPDEEAAEAVLVATVRSGSATRTREWRLTLPALPAGTDDTEAYFWAFFTGEGDGAERVSLAASKGNDALDWNTLNDGQPVFSSDLGTEGLRDPFIIRSPEGDTFYMIATDLKVAGLPGGFATAQLRGSRYIEVWESDDLVNWSEQRHVKVSSDYAGNTWAPEAFWSEELDTFVVFWASNLYDTTDASARTAVTYNRMMYALTDDFRTFSEPTEWIDVRRGAGRGMIDSTVALEDGVYHRFTKDEASMTIRHERSTDLLDTVEGTLPGTTGPADEWTLVQERVASGLPNGEPGGTFSSGEGANIFRANEGDVNGLDWFLFIDQPDYHGGPNHYIPFGTDDLDSRSWTPLGSKLRENLPQNADGGEPRHGTVIPVTREEYERILRAYAPEIAVTDAAVEQVSTEAGTAPVLPTTATLTTAAGSTRTATVVWDDVDPADYAAPGTFTVRGTAQDDSRRPVTTTVTVVGAAGPQVSVTADTRCVAGRVVQTVRLGNDSDGAVQVVVRSDWGSRSVSLAADGGSSVAFSTRLAQAPAGEVTVTAAAGGAETVTTAAYGARSCG